MFDCAIGVNAPFRFVVPPFVSVKGDGWKIFEAPRYGTPDGDCFARIWIAQNGSLRTSGASPMKLMISSCVIAKFESAVLLFGIGAAVASSVSNIQRFASGAMNWSESWSCHGSRPVTFWKFNVVGS